MKLLPTAAPTAGYVCPMHPEVTSTEPGRCPDCGMKLLPAQLVGSTTGHARPPDTSRRPTTRDGPVADAHAHHVGITRPAGEGIEWEDDMVEVNRMTTPANMRWILLDRDTGERNHGIDWRFRVGRSGEDPAGQRDGLRPPDAPPVPRARRRPVPDPEPRRHRRNRTWCGRTRCWSVAAKPSTSCWTSPIPGCGWRTATSPNTTRAA